MFKPILMTPGPTPIPDRVLRAMSDCQIHHRSAEFTEIVKRATAGLAEVFCTRESPLMLVGSGTAAMVASVVNFFRADDRLLVVRGGKFGERWGEIAGAYGLDFDAIDVEWGRGVVPQEVLARLKTAAYAGVLFQASETSTGAAHPVEEIARLVRAESPHTLVVVDGITAVGSMPVKMDEWDLDVVVAGSQKAFMLPPGLAFLAASERAWARGEGSDLPRYYLDAHKERKKQAKGQTAYTSATSLTLGLVEALDMMLDEGVEAIWARHERMSEACRDAAGALGLGLVAPDSPSRALTAISCGNELPAGPIIKGLRESHGIRVAGGQEHLKGRIFRIGHLGWVDAGDILRTVGALESVLADVGQSFERGAGLAAASRRLYAVP